MTWQPNYRRDLTWRLCAAANMVREHPGSREYLQAAVDHIRVFSPDQFPADFRTQFEEITEAVAYGVELSADEITALGQKVIALCEDTLG